MFAIKATNRGSQASVSGLGWAICVVACLAGLFLAAPAGAALFENFPYPGGSPLAGNGQGIPPWPWRTTSGSQGRILCNTSSLGIHLASDQFRSGLDDEAYLSPLGEGGAVTFAFDIKPYVATQFSTDWWSVTAFTETDYPLLRWMGRSDSLTLYTPHGQFPTQHLVPAFAGVQMTVRVDIDFSLGTLSYAFNGVRPPQHPSLTTSIPLFPGCDDLFNHNDPNIGTMIDKVEIVDYGFPKGGPAVDSNDLPQEGIYLNNLTVESTSLYPRPMPGRTPPSGLLIAQAGGPYTISPGVGLSLDASGSLDEGATITSYRWDLNEDGVFETDAGSQPSHQVDYGYLESLGLGVGSYYISLQETDSLGYVDTVYTPLEVLPEPATLSLLALGGLAAMRRRRN